MFEQALLNTAIPGARARSTLLGVATQCTLLTAAVLVPLVFPDALPRMQTVVGIFTVKAPGPPPGPPPAQPVNATRAPRPLQMHEGVLTTPVSMPAKPVMIDEAPLTAAELGLGSGVPNGVAGGDRNGLPGGIASAVAAQVPVFRPAPPAPPPQGAKAPAAANPDPVRVSRGVQEGLILHKVIPEYPPLARTARISGVVQLMGRIGTDGHIRELQLLSGHPLLVNSALGAVRQWVYRPTLLNGEPVEVIAPITVTFRLN